MPVGMQTPAYGKNYHGMVWDDKMGGYVSPTSGSQTNATNAVNDATTAAAAAAAKNAGPASMAQLQTLQNGAMTSAPGYMSAADTAAAKLGTDSLGETTRANQAGETLSRDKFTQTKADRDRLMGELGGLFGPGGGGPGATTNPITVVDPNDPHAVDPYAEAETAALTASKERGGQRLASSLKGLHGLMADRGISGSGIEAQNTRELFADNMHDQNDTDRSLVAGRADRAGRRADMDWQRKNDVEDRNYAAGQQQLHDRISALLQSFGMTY